MLLPGGGGTEAEDLNRAAKAAKGEYERGFNPLSLEGGPGGLPRKIFQNLCIGERISSHFEAHFSIFYNLNFK